MARISRYLITGIIAWIAGCRALAQPESPPGLQLSFTVFSAQRVTGLGYVPQQDAPLLPLSFYPTSRSPGYQYHGPAIVRFLDFTSGMVAAEISVPLSVRTALFIFTAVDSPMAGGMRYRVQVIDDSVARHPAGGLRILNLSGLVLSGTINRKAVSLPEGRSVSMPAGRSVAINLRTPFKDRTYQAYADTILLKPVERVLLLLLPPFHPGSLEVQSRVLLDAPPVPRP